MFKTDEIMPAEIADLLRQAGHDALTVPEQRMTGQPDVNVAQACQTEKRALISLDLDFSDIRHYPPDAYSGIIILRPAIQSITAIVRLMSQVQSVLANETLDGHLWIVDDSQIRIRGTTGST